ncbi:MAG: efflux transporter outer membrane subunit [Candidatus Omnitrophica bacterium]|nr:efflux transporter outer membrane subunit [Candidatus Omnitrophota bacterium]
MRISEISIHRPVLATMMSAALVLFGVIGLSRLPVRELPDVDPPIVNVTTIYPGASASVVETQVTEPLEEQLASVQGIKTLTSESREQLSSITVEFDLSRTVDIAAQDVRDRVARVRGRLPEDIEEPVVFKQDADAQPIMWVALYSDRYSTLELTTIAETHFKDRLQTVPGVSQVFLGGAKRFAIRLWLDQAKMAARGVTVTDVERALREQSVELPSGRIESWQRELSIETRGQLKTPKEYDRLVVKREGTALVRLQDIGRAAVGVEDERAIARFNSRPAMGLGIVRQSKANTIRVAEGVRKELERIRPHIPEGVEISFPYDESAFVKRSIEEVWVTLLVAFLLVMATIFIFLHNVRSTLVPSITIPVSILSTFGFLYLLGFSVNIVTMLALVLAIGLVVDDAIVVLENIFRHIEEGQPPIQAALTGMKEIAFAVIATTVALVAVFLPMTFQTSVTGRLFIEFAVAISVAVCISSFVALTLAPSIAARILRPKRTEGFASRLAGLFERRLTAFSNWYARRLQGVMRHPVPVAAVTVGVLALSVFFYTQLEREFLPDEDKGRIFSIILTPEGSTSEYTDRMVRKAEAIIQDTPEVQEYFSAVALARGGPGQASQGLAFVRLKDGKRRHVQDIIAGPRGLGARFFKEIEGAIAIPIIPKAIGRGFGQTFQLVLQHHDLDALNTATQTLTNRLRGEPYLLNVRPTFELNKPELRLAIDRDRAAALGVSIQDISRTLQILFGGLDLARINLGGKEYDVIAQLERASRLTPADLNQLYVRSADGRLIQLSGLVTHEVGGGPSAIRHHNRFRSATIEATPLGVPLGTAVERVEHLLRNELPEGFRYEWSGEARDLQEAGADTLFVLGLAILVIYMTLAAQFESLIHPLTVMLTLPLGALGALGSLWALSWVNRFATMVYGWTHYAPSAPAFAHWLDALLPRIPAMGINLFSQIGMILLLGLVTKNGILLVEFANQHRAQGKSAEDAMTAAARIRLRPILMTATSTIAGILPIAIGFGAGAESRRPMGVAAVGGMLTSTLLTLFVVPTVYVWFSHLSEWRARRPQPAWLTMRRAPGVLPILSGVLGAWLSGCAVGPTYQRPSLEAPTAWKEAPKAPDTGVWQEARPQDAVARGAWWELFSNPELNLLQAQAVHANRSVAAALARLNRARAVARLPKADLVPTLESHLTYDHFQRTLSGFGGRGSFTNDDFHVPLDLSYEVDLWGKVRRSFEAAYADAQASQAAYETVLLSVTAEVARTYFLLRALDTELDALRTTVELRRQAEQLIHQRVDAGLSSELETTRVIAEVKTAEAESLDVARQRAQLEHALAVLCGRAASEFSLPAEPLEAVPPHVPPGIPSRVLERRPDIAEAERLMAAANARIGVAKAASFPVLTLTGSAGWQAAKLENLITADSVVWSLGPSLSVPIFAGGRNAANVKAAMADHAQAAAEYRRRILLAFQEVEDALAAIRLLAYQQEAQAGVVDASQQAARLSLERFRQGLVSFLDVVDAERSRLEAERRAAQIRGQRMAAAVLLIKALGGGWEGVLAPSTPQDTPPSPGDSVQAQPPYL